MKSVLVILAEFYPYPSSNTNCIEPFLYGLLNEGYEVDVVTRRHDINLPTQESYNGLNIIRVDDYKTMNTVAFSKLLKNKTNKYLKIINNSLSFISKVFFSLNYRDIYGEQRYAGWDIEKVMQTCNSLNETQKYNFILSISHPIITHRIAYTLKKEFKTSKWAIFEFDPFAYNDDEYGRFNRKKRVLQESEFFKQCDKVFLTPELFEFYKDTPLNKFSGKFHKFNFPNMNEISFEREKSLLKKHEGKFDAVYGGALLKTIRNPVFMMSFLQELNDIVNVTIMSNSRVKFLKKEIKKMSSLNFYSGQNKEIAHATMLDSDILVNIGNTVVFQTPGKIFEYMSMGKPIIHFSKIQNDPSIRYLKKYPLLFIVNEMTLDIKKEIENCRKFIIENKGKKLTFGEVMECMPEMDSDYIVGSFLEQISSLN